MKLIKIGSVGNEVKEWQAFLIGMNFKYVKIDGDFGKDTEKYTKKWQAKYNLKDDGIVGNESYKIAKLQGYSSLNKQQLPPKPNFSSLTQEQKQKMFGPLKYSYSPTSTNKEKVKCTNDFRKNVIKIYIPSLNKNIWFHKLGKKQILALFAEIEEKGLTHLILSWGGTWSLRFIRGSRTRLSAHAFATAFDINMKWNRLGRMPAQKGTQGSVIDLVPIANKHGFFWGGHYNRRKDGMHFELVKLIK